MENNLREQQIEAIKAFSEYNIRLVKAMYMIIEELQAERKEDTDEFQQKIINGINWEIEILNRTMSLINEEEVYIKKEEINKIIINLSNAIKEKEDSKIARVLQEEVIPTFEEIGIIVNKTLQEKV